MMERKIVVTFDKDNNEYPYNAQVWSFIRGKWYYSGFGKFCSSIEEALKYANERDLPVEFS